MSDTDFPSPPEEAPELPATETARLRRRGVRSLVRKFFLFLILGVIILASVEGVGLWRDHFRDYKSTNNAYVQATVVPVSSQVEGVVSELLVGDNQAVHAGDLLVRLDARRFQVAVEKAEAAVGVARARYESSKISVVYSQGRGRALLGEARARLATLHKTLRSARALLVQRRKETHGTAATLSRTREDLRRTRELHRQRVISNEDLTLGEAYFKVAQANYEASTAALQVEEEKVAAMGQQVKELQASVALAKNEGRSGRVKELDSESLRSEVRSAQADLKEARLFLSYAEIRAPVSGYVGKTLDPGTYVEKGRPLLSIVQLHRAYIRANFKEGQLEEIHVGQPVTVVVDAYPNRPFRGHVDSVYSGTGDAFSLLPAENATGNWVKITRRIPVKIVLDEAPPPQFPLLVGMSAEVRVDVRDRSGARLLAYPRRTEKRTDPIR
jgi:membrane fusion protein (multidrug efflux system)